jgi:hypothetical protein
MDRGWTCPPSRRTVTRSLFFEDGHAGLLDLLGRILAPEGRVVMTAPDRSGSAARFAARAASADHTWSTALVPLAEWAADDPVVVTALARLRSVPGFTDDRDWPLLLTMGRTRPS